MRMSGVTPKCSQLPASGLPEDAEAMSVVHHQERVVALTEARDLVERSQVAVHRIDAGDDDEPARVVPDCAGGCTPSLTRSLCGKIRSSAPDWAQPSAML
jgi:hypothetical protein